MIFSKFAKQRPLCGIRYFSTTKKFTKIAVANRGEIACRVFRTCKKLGIRTVALHSEADKDAVHVSMADESICVGPAPSAQSYLQIDRIVQACKMLNVDAVHPGYGFLSENNAFAAALEKNGISFIGPGAYAIEVMGDKIMSKNCANDAKVNTIPGDSRVIKDADECVEVSRALGYPVMVKASAGGGGKGMRIAWDDAECRTAFALSTNEARNSFGDDRLFVEKFIEEPRHIEIQVLCDTHGNALWLNERECSIQRRNQKVIEEAPSVVLDPETRKAMGEQAVQLAKAVQYKSAGTVEFLVDKYKNFYFLEMNTRLQVEHPVTEYITGVDLVEQMIQVAEGKPLSYTQNDIGINGWAFESRVYAEDPFKGFLPSIGTLEKYVEPFPGAEDVRSDSGVREGSAIQVHYDPMICKLVTYGRNREESLERMREALDSYVIHGVKHNIPFLRALCDHPKFISGDITTKFIEEEYPEGFQVPEMTPEVQNPLLITAALLSGRTGDLILTLEEDTIISGSVNGSTVTVGSDSCSCSIDYDSVTSICNVDMGGKSQILQLFDQAPVIHEEATSSIGTAFTLLVKGHKYRVEVRSPAEEEEFQKLPKPEKVDFTKMLRSPMPGTLMSLKIKAGDIITQGQEVCIIEAMKMQNVFTAQKSGTVKAVYVEENKMLSADELIYELE